MKHTILSLMLTVAALAAGASSQTSPKFSDYAAKSVKVETITVDCERSAVPLRAGTPCSA